MARKTTFSTRHLTGSETLGERLRATREAMGATLEEAHRTTGIQQRYLQSLEQSAYAELPGDVYVRKFLQVYADYLGLNPRTALKYYRQEREVAPASHDDQEPMFQAAARRRDFFVTPRTIRTALAVLILVGVVGYLGYGVRAALQPPILELTAPADNAVTTVDSVDVQGRTEPEATLTMNGQAVLPDLDGKFSERLYLQEGINVIHVSSERTDGRSAELTRHVLYRATAEIDDGNSHSLMP